MHDRRGEIDVRVGKVLHERLLPLTHTVLGPLTLERWDVPPAEDGHVGEPVTYAEARSQTYAPAQVGDPWGWAWGTTWLHVTGQVPDDARSPELLVDLGWAGRRPGMQAEALVHRDDGSTVKALNPHNNWIPCAPGEEIDLWIEAAANPVIGPAGGPTPEGDRATSRHTPIYSISRADVCEVNHDVVELCADLDVLLEQRMALPDESARQWQVISAMEAAVDALDLHDDSSILATAADARAELAGVLGRKAEDGGHRISAVGHAHIDSAWLWPVRETKRKVARTCANVVALMERDESLVYAMSSAQQWAWLQETQPALFERVRAFVEAGRFVPVGGMWVESDTNMVGGEAMARQFVQGKRWMIEELGVEPEEVWLPDSFGYTAALPQIVRLAGFRWFLTQKISWNKTNLFPHHTFWWEGIDGTRVFTHFPPADTYNGTLSGTEIARSAKNFREKGKATHALIPFGYGDGGGGPTREMLGRARREADLAGSPRVSIESPRRFFEQAEAEYPDAPVWAGELYLEIHRGTYTSQARTKAGNRRSEHLLREAELWCTTAAVRGLLDYPYERLRDAWRLVLLQQFHDILPGSSIAWVHQEAERHYAEVAAELTSVIEEAQTALGGGVFNAGPVALEGVPPLSAVTSCDPRPQAHASQDVSGAVLENDELRVSVDAGGVIRSILDKATDREVVAPGGAGNRLTLHPDTPNNWDAWDLDSFYRHRSTDLVDGRVSVEDDRVVVEHAFGDSTLRQEITLHGSCVDLATTVDWHERHTVLKLGVDADVHTDQARFETQFGHVVRPTHVNTSWDAARFEVCAHRWVQVAETGYAVGLANATTYGHDVTRHPRDGGATYSRVRATLLRAPRYPDPQTDQGEHVFRHAIVVGGGVAETVAAGYRLNLPLRGLESVRPTDTEPEVEEVAQRPSRDRRPIVAVEGPALVEAVKLAEDGSGDVVLRLYEPLGARARITVTPGFEAGDPQVVDLLERPLDETWDGTLRPFQILTLRWSR